MKQYKKAEIKMISLEADNVILKGSVVKTEVAPSTVEVVPLDNGFSSETDGFRSLNFD